MSQTLDQALAGLDRAMAARPRLDGQAFTEATQAICAYRDALRVQGRETPGDLDLRRSLKAANLAVTLLLAGHFPLGETPWAELEGLHQHLEAMKRDDAA